MGNSYATVGVALALLLILALVWLGVRAWRKRSAAMPPDQQASRSSGGRGEERP